MRPIRVFVLPLALGWPAAAVAITELGDSWLTLDGNLRATTVATQNYDQDVVWGRDNGSDGQTDVALRLVATGRPRDLVRWEMHVVQRLTLITSPSAPAGSSTLFGASGSAIPYRTVDTRWEWGKGEDVNAWVYLDRANVKLGLAQADVIIGRQAITFGKVYFWNPLDVFLAFGATQFDRDYKAGVDALRVDVPVGDFSGATLIGVPGHVEAESPAHTADESLWYRSALMARVYSNLREWDVAAQGGKILGGHQIGGAVAGELGSVEVRGEAAWFAAQDEGLPTGVLPAPVIEDHLSAVAGTGCSLVGGDLQLQAEYYYNGAARGLRRERFALIAAGHLQHVNRHMVGSVATYQLHPLLFGSLAALWGLSDSSGLLQPGLVYSAADEVDVVAGAVVAWGLRPTGTTVDDFRFRSEFGTYPNFYYLETKVYF